MRRTLAIAALGLVLLGAMGLFVDRWHFMVDQPPVDFQLNWVAAHRLVHREPLYDRPASRADGFELIGDSIIPEFSSGVTYASFIGTPATALLYTPFLPFGPHTGADLYRVADALLMLVAIGITGFALPKRSRAPAWFVGAFAFLVFYPVQESIGLGQLDGMIMCALGVAYWAVARKRWPVAGAALGVATLLKISPGLVLVYLLLRGVRRVFVPAVTTIAGVLVAGALVGRPGDVVTWITDVVPKLARGGLLVNNQSLPAWLHRLFGSDLAWLSLDADLGAWRLIAPVVIVIGVGIVYGLCRHRPLALLELGAVVLVALVAGPLSWDHYASWVILTLMLMADVAYWRRRRPLETAGLLAVLAVATVLMHKLTLYPTPDVIAGDWTRRVESGTKTVAMIGYLAVACWLLARTPSTEEAAERDRRLAVDDHRPAGVHAQG
jgi:alpha-1,2-mannosyltransferase